MASVVDLDSFWHFAQTIFDANGGLELYLETGKAAARLVRLARETGELSEQGHVKIDV